MPLSVFIEMTLSAILTVWSPGPNNILLLSTASKYGISGNIRFMTGKLGSVRGTTCYFVL